MRSSACPLVCVDVRMVNASGIGVYIKNVLPRLIARSDWCFVLLEDGDETGSLTGSDDARVVRKRIKSPIYSLSQQFELAANIPNEAALYWSPHYDIPLFVRPPLLVTVHDMAHLALPDVFPGFAKQAYAKAMATAVRIKSRHIMFDSQFSENEFIRLVGNPRGGRSVVHLGIDDAWRYQCTSGQSAAKPYIIYVGNLKPHKNVGGLVAAFDKISDQIPHDLVIVGKREGFLVADPQVAEIVARGSDRLIFTGLIPDEALRDRVAKADLLVLPSFYEGFGLTPLEAMASGCPVAVSNAASLPEVCADAAIYFDPTDKDDIASAMLCVLTDPKLSSELKALGVQRAAEFSWDKCADRIQAIMNDTMCVS